MLRHLASRMDVHLACFVDDEEDWRHLDALRAICASVKACPLRRGVAAIRSLTGLMSGSPLTLPYYWDGRLARYIHELHATRTIDVQFASSAALVQYASEVSHAHLPLVIDFMDVDSEKWAEYARRCAFPWSWIYRREARRLAAAEVQMAESASVALFVSETEAQLFRDRAPGTASKVYAVSNGVDSEYFFPSSTFENPYPAGGPVLVFVGVMDYWANIDAVLWFANDVLPLVLRHTPSARFAIVGSRPSPAVLALARNPGVIVTGTVLDVRPYVAHAAVSIAPLRIARGIQNKVLEAMSMAKAVVASGPAFEGIQAEPANEIILADEAEQLASAIVSLLVDDVRRHALGERARARVLDSYAWRSCLSALDGILARTGICISNTRGGGIE